MVPLILELDIKSYKWSINGSCVESRRKSYHPKMSSLDSTPALEPINSNRPGIGPWSVELEKHRHAGLLAQIEVASCFRNEPEPLHCSAYYTKPNNLEHAELRVYEGFEISSSY